MTITELYQKIPASQHHTIVIARDSLYITDERGTEVMKEYLIKADGNLLLLRDESPEDIKKIRTKVGA